MKQTGSRLAAVALALTSFTFAQDQKDSTKKDAAATAPATTSKHLPQAKTDAEFAAYSAAVASTTPEAAEKAADDFAAKYPGSEIKILVYKQAMQLYQNANNVDKVIDMGHKCLAIDPDDPQVLANTAQALTDRPSPTDADKEEAQKDAETALQTVDTDLIVNPGTPQEKVTEYKGFLRSTAFGSLGIIYYTKDTKEGYAKAEEYLRKSIDAVPSQPDPVTMLRLAIAMDKQDKYTAALEETNKVVAMTKGGTSTGDTARREQSRLQTLTKDLIK